MSCWGLPNFILLVQTSLIIDLEIQLSWCEKNEPGKSSLLYRSFQKDKCSRLYYLKDLLIYVSIWPCQVLVAVHGILLALCGIFCWGTWTLCLWFLGWVAACGILVPWPGIEPNCPALEIRFLTTGQPGKCPCLLSDHITALISFCRLHSSEATFYTLKAPLPSPPYPLSTPVWHLGTWDSQKPFRFQCKSTQRGGPLQACCLSRSGTLRTWSLHYRGADVQPGSPS